MGVVWRKAAVFLVPSQFGSVAPVSLYLRRGERWLGRPDTLLGGRIVDWRRFKRLTRRTNIKRLARSPALF